MRPSRAMWDALDVVVACAFAVGASFDVSRLGGDYVFAEFLAVGCVSTVAWRRRAPAVAAAAAVTALLVYQVATDDPRMTFEPFAVVLTVYLLGREDATRRLSRASGVLLVYGLVALGVTFRHSSGDRVAETVGGWTLFIVIPWGVGRLVARHEALAGELESETLLLRADQRLRAQEAANDERFRMARELHDVVAHCVSVMVIQASAARVVAPTDPEAALEALKRVGACGREAMVELRRIIGAVGHEDDQSELRVPDISGVGLLVERACSAGLPTRLRIARSVPGLSPEIGLAVYRIVQEALTNSLKHAPGGTASVGITTENDVLEVTVADTGSGRPAVVEESRKLGHGLIGIRERAASLKGNALVGPSPRGGWEVAVRIPLAAGVSVEVAESAVAHDFRRRRWRRRRTSGWGDAVFVCLWLIALEVEAFSSAHRHGSLWLNGVIVGSMAVSMSWRRRNPLLFLAVVGVLGLPLDHGLTSRHYGTLTGLYSVVVPLYTVAAWAGRGRAVQGLAVWGLAATTIGVFERSALSGLAGPLVLAACAWAIGRVMREHRILTARLRETSRRLHAERADRVRLAAIGERIRIARDLQKLVAHEIIELIVLSEAAEGLAADSAATTIESIEATGRRTLVQLRSILGVLRSPNIDHNLEPQPGLEQIHDLIERARGNGAAIDFAVSGQPGDAAFAGVDLTTYRILEELLADTADSPSELSILLRFDLVSLQLDLRSTRMTSRAWPTDAVRERVALCKGELDATTDNESGGHRLTIRVPRTARGAFS